MPENSLQQLYVEQLKDLYNAETQLVKALPKMAKAAKSEALREGFEQHLNRREVMFSGSSRFLRPWMKAPKGANAPECKASPRRGKKC